MENYSLFKKGETYVIDTVEATIVMDRLSFGSVTDRLNILHKCIIHLDGKSVELEGSDEGDIVQLNATVKYKSKDEKMDLVFKYEDHIPKLIELLTK